MVLSNAQRKAMFAKFNDQQLKEIHDMGNKELRRKEIQGIQLSEADDLKAEKVANAFIELRTRSSNQLERDRKEIEQRLEKDEAFQAIKKLQDDPKFHLDPTHTYGKINEDLKIPTYSEGFIFAQKPEESGRKVWRIGKEGGRTGISFIDEGLLKEVAKDAGVSERQFTSQAKVESASEKNKPVVFKLKDTSYLIAPVIREEEE